LTGELLSLLSNPAVAMLGEESLLLAADPKHKYLRGLLTPAFSDDSINR
jgi:cytochrome P450